MDLSLDRLRDNDYDDDDYGDDNDKHLQLCLRIFMTFYQVARCFFVVGYGAVKRAECI
jgi:hypothetical protein